MQNVDLNMVPQVEESAPPVDTLPIMRPTSTREYQISLIESRGPNSRGVQMLRAAMADIGKTYVPPLVTTGDTTPLGNPTETLRIPRPLATREQQIAFIESRGPNSRGVQLLHAGLADLARMTPPQPDPPMVSLPLEGPKHYPQCDGQFIRLYPKYSRS